jgi:lysozyme
MSDPRTPVFEAIRAIGPRNPFNEAGNIVALHNLLDAFGIPRAPSGGMRVSPAGIALIHSFEDLRLAAYPDPGSKNGKPWTIGWGSTTDEAGKPILPGTIWSKERCDARFAQSIAAFEGGVTRLIGSAPTSQAQFDALVSFAYNCGLDEDEDTIAEGLGDSTLLKKHNAGDYAGAAAAFASWVYNDGRKMAGLERRRAAEARHYQGLS